MLKVNGIDERRAAFLCIQALAIEIGNGFFIVQVITGSNTGFLLADGAIDSHANSG